MQPVNFASSTSPGQGWAPSASPGGADSPRNNLLTPPAYAYAQQPQQQWTQPQTETGAVPSTATSNSNSTSQTYTVFGKTLTRQQLFVMGGVAIAVFLVVLVVIIAVAASSGSSSSSNNAPTYPGNHFTVSEWQPGVVQLNGSEVASVDYRAGTVTLPASAAVKHPELNVSWMPVWATKHHSCQKRRRQ